MASVANLYSAVHAAWTEGRLENVLERQKQLALLHGNVKKSSKQLIATIMQELKSGEESAAAELQLVLENIKHYYDVLDFPATLTKEAAVRKGSSNMDNSVPLGPTLIDANPFVPVASTLIPLAAAVAAGSAVLVLALSGLPILNTELRRIISASLDVEAVATTPDDSSDTREQLCAMRFEVAVLQNSSHWNDLRNGLFMTNPTIRVHSPATGFPAVFVDRSTRDVEAVAKHLYHAVLCAPRHNPSRVPRLCFVDESKAKDLESYLVRAGPASIRRLEVAKDWQSTPKLCKLLQTVFPSLVNKAISHDTFASVIALESSDSITVDSIGAVAQSMAMSDRGILLIPISSMDHGIDILNKLYMNKAGPSEIVFAFGDGKAGLYVGSFVKTLQVCINEVPAWSLVFETSPSSQSKSDKIWYSPEAFSFNKPIRQGPPKASPKPSSGRNVLWPVLAHTLSLGKIKQPKGGRLSYFERGLLIGLAIGLLTITGASVAVRRVIQSFLKRS